MMKKIIAILLLVNFCTNLSSQGLIFDKEAFDKGKKIEKSRTELPLRASLKMYAPYTHFQQGGTCVAYSFATARTILWAYNNGITDQKTISSNSFSPFYIYYRNKDRSDINCEKGINAETAALDLLNNGVAKIIDVEYPDYYPFTNKWLCNTYPPDYNIDCANGQKFRLTEVYRTENLDELKTALALNMPVVLGIAMPESFEKCIGKDLFVLSENEKIDPSSGHAVVAVSYDDDKYGGAVEILNSWGSNWGNDGYVWIQYKDLLKFVLGGYAFSRDSDALSESTEKIGEGINDGVKGKLTSPVESIALDSLVNTRYLELLKSSK
jgi:hypothetical protein